MSADKSGCECWGCRPDLMAAEYARLGKPVPEHEIKALTQTIARLNAEIERWRAGDDTWQALAFAYVNAEPGSDRCAQAWHELEAAVRHYEAVEQRRVHEADVGGGGRC